MIKISERCAGAWDEGAWFKVSDKTKEYLL